MKVNGLTGEILWEKDLETNIASSPAIGRDDTIYIGAGNDIFYALDSQNGNIKWQLESGGKFLSSPALSDEGIIYVGSRDGKLYAIKGSSGPADSPWPMFGQNAQRTGRKYTLEDGSG